MFTDGQHNNNLEGENLTLKQAAWFSLKITSRNQQLMTTSMTDDPSSETQARKSNRYVM